jgi:hypothetical protein
VSLVGRDETNAIGESWRSQRLAGQSSALRKRVDGAVFNRDRGHDPGRLSQSFVQ